MEWEGHPMAWQSELEALIQETQALTNAVQAQMIPKPISSAKLTKQMPLEFSQPTQIEPISKAASSPEREEIKRRVANFKAVQDRMQREREDYFVKTLADARQGLRVTSPPRGT
jgi:hypothetical protein